MLTFKDFVKKDMDNMKIRLNIVNIFIIIFFFFGIFV
ncbi:hypothetical protein PB1_02340 [Bacillus methanolicus PB1]|uniref:Uncharacterized protein n=1 Tax=Bacillus methanolicus PB1 TaxID=997296 RepID=I3E5H0_BACMT|nr:hypothetical protein PB1_02340 [Bacillus methanolicus PB1]